MPPDTPQSDPDAGSETGPEKGPDTGPDTDPETRGNEVPDFARDVFVAQKPGPEFTGVPVGGTMAQLIMSQGMFGIIGAVFMGMLILRPVFGVSPVAMILIGSGVMIVGTFVVVRIMGGANANNRYASVAYSSSTDTRYRLRVVLPKRRATSSAVRWLASIENRDDTPDESELAYVRGGFEPAIARVWFGVKHADRGYRWTAGVIALAIVLAIVGLGVSTSMNILWGGPGGGVMGFMWFALVALVLAGSMIGAEACWPVYVRVVPGRMDIFRFGFLGSGTPRVRSIDLTERPMCLDFGTYSLVVEPARPPGEPMPALVMSKRWPYNKVMPEGHEVELITLLLVPSRAHLSRRIIQAARSTEPAPELPMDRLLG